MIQRDRSDTKSNPSRGRIRRGPGDRDPRFRMLRTYDVPPAFVPGRDFRGYVGYDDNGLPVVAPGHRAGLPEEAWRTRWSSRPRSGRSRCARPACWPRPPRRPQRQMAEDIHYIEVTNDKACTRQHDIAPVLEVGRRAPVSLGDDEDAWRGWWFDTLGYSYQASPKPTITEEVQTQYEPYAIGLASPPARRSTPATVPGRSRRSRSATRSSARTVRPGPGFQPVVFVHRNPPGQDLEDHALRRPVGRVQRLSPVLAQPRLGPGPRAQAG